MDSHFSPRFRQLHGYEYVVIAAVACVIAGFLPIVIRRVTVQGFGDVLVFFRAGWAVWADYPLYAVTDHHGWSYHYPPTFAILMGLFADPLPGYPKPSWSLPLHASVALWYCVSVAAMGWALHVWARALERCGMQQFRQDAWNGWWALRLGPFLALLPFIGDGFGRGQPTAVVLLSMAGFLALYLRGRIRAAAFVLAVGIAIKMFPVVLLLLPLLRRDLRAIVATALWTLALLILFPMLCVGPATTFDLYAAMWNDHLRGILSGVPSAAVAAEITFTSYDMLSVGAMLARLAVNGLPETAALPGWANAAQLAADLAFVGALVGIGHRRFWRWGRAQPQLPYALLIAGATVCAALPVMLSVSQPNYVALAAPLVAIAQVESWRRCGQVAPSLGLVAWSALAWIGMVTTETPIWHPLQVLGLTTPALIGLVGWGLYCLARQPLQDIAASASPAGAP